MSLKRILDEKKNRENKYRVATSVIFKPNAWVKFFNNPKLWVREEYEKGKIEMELICQYVFYLKESKTNESNLQRIIATRNKIIQKEWRNTANKVWQHKGKSHEIHQNHCCLRTMIHNQKYRAKQRYLPSLRKMQITRNLPTPWAK